MTTHTDRIKQMAQEARLLPCYEVYDDDLARFAQLVAEDCARIADESEPRRGVGDEIRYYYSPTVAAPSQAG